MADYNFDINVNRPVRFEFGREVAPYQFRVEYAEDTSTGLLYRNFSTFSERKVALSLICSLAFAFKEVFMPPCSWLFHVAKSSFYKKGSHQARQEAKLAEKVIAPWLKGRTIFVIPTAFLLTALGLAAAVSSLFVSVQKDTCLFRLAAKMDRLASGLSEENYIEMPINDRFKDVSYLVPEIQPVASALVSVDRSDYEDGLVTVDQRDLYNWSRMNQEVITNALDTESFEDFQKRKLS